MYYVYLLISLKSGIFYIGQTENLLQRFLEHNKNRSEFTKHKGPWALLAFKQFPSRSAAMTEEYRLKKLKNRQRILLEFGIEFSDLNLVRKEA